MVKESQCTNLVLKYFFMGANFPMPLKFHPLCNDVMTQIKNDQHQAGILLMDENLTMTYKF